MLTHKDRKLTWIEKLFIGTTVALLLFGVLGYFLAELPGGYLDEWQIRPLDVIIDSILFDKYLIYLVLSVIVGVVLYRGMTFLKSREHSLKWLRIREMAQRDAAAGSVVMLFLLLEMKNDESADFNDHKYHFLHRYLQLEKICDILNQS